MNKIPVWLACCAVGLLGCDVTRQALPAYPSAAADAAANRSLAGRAAVVTMRNDDESVERRHAHAVQVDADGSIAVEAAQSVYTPGSDAPHYAWTEIPRAGVVEISTVDHDRGARKGFVIGGLLGFVPTTLAFYGIFESSFRGSCPELEACTQPNAGAALAVGAGFGVLAGLVTGGIGAAVGWLLGDGTVVTVAPYAPSSAAALVAR